MEKLKDLINQREGLFEEIEAAKYNMSEIDKIIKRQLIEEGMQHLLTINWKGLSNTIRNSQKEAD